MSFSPHEVSILATVIGIATAYVIVFLVYEKTIK